MSSEGNVWGRQELNGKRVVPDAGKLLIALLVQHVNRRALEITTA